METFNKMTNNDLALSEKIKLLFKEQGITIISVLTAIGDIIVALVEGLIGGSTEGTARGSTPSNNGGGEKEWIQNKLKSLGSDVSLKCGWDITWDNRSNNKLAIQNS